MTYDDQSGSKPGQNTVTTFRSPDAAMMGFVSARLRAMYDDLCREPIPTRLLEVVESFDRTADSQRRRGDLRNGTEN